MGDKVRILLCEDEELLRRTLEQEAQTALQELGWEGEVRGFSQGRELLAFVEAHRESGEIPTLCLLDVQLPGMDGFALAKALRHTGLCFGLIFITVATHRVFEAFEPEAVAYLSKPVSARQLIPPFQQAFHQAKLRLAARAAHREKHLEIQTGGKIQSIPLGHLAYCEVIDRKLYLHTTEGVVEYYGRLSQLEQQVDKRFLKCHRSYLVNLDYFREYAGAELRLTTGDRIPVARAKQKQIPQALLRYLKEKGKDW